MADWISVRSRKQRPPIGQCVLVCGDGQGNVFTASYCGRGKWDEWCTEARDGGVSQPLPFKPTHWQHTPDAVDALEDEW